MIEKLILFPPSEKVLQLFCFGYFFLFIYSGIIFILRRFRPSGDYEKAWLKAKTWWPITIVLCSAVSAGPLGLIALFILLSIFASHELLVCFGLNSKLQRTLSLIAIALMVLRYLFDGLDLGNFAGIMIIGILSILTALRDAPPKMVLRNIFIFGFIVVVIDSIGAIPEIVLNSHQWSLDPKLKMLSVTYLIIIISISDALQFLSGSIIVSKKIFPNISPQKSVSGYLFGGGIAIGVGALVATKAFQFEVGSAILLAGTVVVSGAIGDLFFSLIKRTQSIKDYSNLLPGHGGVLDRFDSLIFSAPLFLFVIRVITL